MVKTDLRLITISWVCKRCHSLVVTNSRNLTQKFKKCPHCEQLYELFVDLSVIGKKRV